MLGGEKANKWLKKNLYPCSFLLSHASVLARLTHNLYELLFVSQLLCSQAGSLWEANGKRFLPFCGGVPTWQCLDFAILWLLF